MSVALKLLAGLSVAALTAGAAEETMPFGCRQVRVGEKGGSLQLDVRGVDFASAPRFALDVYATDLSSERDFYLALTDGKGAKRRYPICDLRSGQWNAATFDRDRDVVYEKGKLDWSDVRTAGIWIPATTNANATYWFGNVRPIADPFVCRAPAAGERRFAWCLAKAYADQGDWEATATFLASHQFTDVIVQAGRMGGVHYDSTIVPRARNTPRQDVLRAALAACRPRGIRVHAMVCAFRCAKDETPDARWRQLAESGLFQVTAPTAKGKPKTDKWLCPTDARTRELVLSVVRELVEKVGVDGVQLDYIRFNSPDQCVCPRCLKAFGARMGRDFADLAAIRADPSALDAWLTFREDNVASVVKAVGDYVHAAGRPVEVSATCFPDCEARRAALAQDYARWAHAGWIDFLFPMDYTCDPRAFRLTVTRQARAIAGSKTKLIPGIAVCTPPMSAHPERYVADVNFVRELGLAGFAAYVLDARGAGFYRSLDAVVPSSGK